jgi:hypothetical protein
MVDLFLLKTFWGCDFLKKSIAMLLIILIFVFSFIFSNATSLTTGGTAFSTAGYYSAPANAFDGSTTTYFDIYGVGLPVFHGYHVSSATVVNSYSILSYSSQTTYKLTNFTFEASNDGTNYVVLNTQVNQTALDWSVFQTFSFYNDTAYLYYRLNVTSTYPSNDRLKIRELQMNYDSSVTPSPTPSPSPTPTPSPSPTPTPTPSPTPSPTPTSTPTPSPTPTPIPSPTPSPTPSCTPMPTPTPVPFYEDASASLAFDNDVTNFLVTQCYMLGFIAISIIVLIFFLGMRSNL